MNSAVTQSYLSEDQISSPLSKSGSLCPRLWLHWECVSVLTLWKVCKVWHYANARINPRNIVTSSTITGQRTSISSILKSSTRLVSGSFSFREWQLSSLNGLEVNLYSKPTWCSSDGALSDWRRTHYLPLNCLKVSIKEWYMNACL